MSTQESEVLQEELDVTRAELLDRLDQLKQEQHTISMRDAKALEAFRMRLEELRREAAVLAQSRVPDKK